MATKKRRISKVMASPKAAIPLKVVILCSDSFRKQLFFDPVENIHTCLHLSTTGTLISVLRMAVMEDLTALCFLKKIRRFK